MNVADQVTKLVDKYPDNETLGKEIRRLAYHKFDSYIYDMYDYNRVEQEKDIPIEINPRSNR